MEIYIRNGGNSVILRWTIMISLYLISQSLQPSIDWRFSSGVVSILKIFEHDKPMRNQP